MAGITQAPSTVQAIFSLDIITAAVAFVLFLVAAGLATVRLKNNRALRNENQQRSENGLVPLKSSFWTYLLLIPVLFCLTIAYAVQAAVVARQSVTNIPVSVDASYDYHYGGPSSSLSSSDIVSGRTISILSFTRQLASILTTVSLTGAVWLHSTNLKNNGTGVASPGVTSRLWNAFILVVMLGLGVASWARGLYVRQSGRNALSYPETIKDDMATRNVYIAFRVWVIAASTSVTIQVIANYANLKKNGARGNLERPLLARFAFLIVPVIWPRNIMIIFSIVVLYLTVTDWSRPSSEAVAFLLIIFGQFANLFILFMVLWGAWSMGRSAGKNMDKSSSSTWS